MVSFMNIDDVTEFLRNVPPFQELDESTLRNIAGTVSMEFYPKGSTILQQEGPASEYLRIVRKGAVKVFIRSGKHDEVAIDSRTEGDTFGFLSLVSGDKSRANVVALEDTTCYLISKENILKLLETHPVFAEYFLVSFLNKYIDKTYKEIHKRNLLYGGGDRLLFTTPVGELITKEVITANQDISIREAAEMMSQNRISSLVLLDAHGVPSGVVTDRDLRDKVVSKGRSTADSASGIMSVSLIKADAKEYCFESLLRMIRYGVHHLLVIENGRLKGVITNHDLMMLQGTSPVSVAREIESQQTVEGLIPLSKKTNKLIDLLLKEGAKASNISRVITEINDRLVRKVLEITEKRLGTPPVKYCWVVFGSEGRKEQTFKTDQDNAIIYEDPENTAKAEEAKTYFSAFTLLVRDGLLKFGFPPCPADYMASNSRWCQPLGIWKKYFADWINDPTPDAVLKSLIFFDFRPLHGEFGLAEELRDSLTSMLEGQMLFLGYMANTIINNMPPLSLFKSFVVEKSGEHKDEFDLKVKGIAPLVDAVRLFALERGVRETSTLERINALKGRHTIVKEYADELEHAFEFIMLLRIQNQIEQIESGKNPDNFINPQKLSNLEKRTIKDEFHLISKMQGLIIERYKPMIW
jgi:CBS domain-containing protein